MKSNCSALQTLSEYSQHQLVKNCYHQLKYRKRPCLLRINVCIGQFPFTCCWQMAMFTWDRLRSAQSTGQSRQQTVLLRVPVAHSLSTSTIYKRSPALKIYQMSSDSIPAHWSSKSRFKFLYACAKELEDCKMNLTRFTRGAAITGVGKNHSEFSMNSWKLTIVRHPPHRHPPHQTSTTPWVK